MTIPCRTWPIRRRHAPIAALLVAVVAALASPRAGGAEEKISVRRVGVLTWKQGKVSNLIREGIREGLLRTRLPIQFEERQCSGRNREAESTLADWTKRDFDLFIAVDPQAAVFLEDRIRDKPIVFATTSHPVRSGVTKHLGPGRRNLAGVFLQLDMRSILDFYRSVIPGLDRVGVLHFDSGQASLADIREAESLEKSDAPGGRPPIRFERAPVKKAEGWPSVRAAIELLASRGVGALWLPDDPDLLDFLPRIAEVTDLKGIPLIATHPTGVRRHVTVGVSPDYRALGIRASALCARIVRKGTDPGEIPVSVVRSCNLIVNLRAAHRASLVVPLEALVRADVIIDRDGW